jgi:hypothetical protein
LLEVISNIESKVNDTYETTENVFTELMMLFPAALIKVSAGKDHSLVAKIADFFANFNNEAKETLMPG